MHARSEIRLPRLSHFSDHQFLDIITYRLLARDPPAYPLTEELLVLTTLTKQNIQLRTEPAR